MVQAITVIVAPKVCQFELRTEVKCGARLKRIRGRSWRKGYTFCPVGHHNWYGEGMKKRVWKR